MGDRGERKTLGILEHIEDMLPCARATNDATLMRLLHDNKDTEFGLEHAFGDIDGPAEFKRRVPLTDYDTYAPYVERMVRGEKNLLTAYPVAMYALTTGSMGPSKLIPVSEQALRDYVSYGSLLHQDVFVRHALERGIDPGRDLKKTFLPMVEARHAPDGTLVTNFSGALYLSLKDSITCVLAGPSEILYGTWEADYMYLKALFALRERDLTFIGSSFTSLACAFFRLIEQEHDRLCRDIELGRCDRGRDVPDELRRIVDLALVPDPARADELRSIFAEGFDRPIVRRVWPHFRYLNAIGGGSFLPYTEELRRYTGDVPLSLSIYASSEGAFAACIEMDTTDAVLIPDVAYFEFIPEEDMDGDPAYLMGHTLSLDELEEGRNYEIVVTNLSGFYRYRIGDVLRVSGHIGTSPALCFSYRRGQLVSIQGEKTSERHLQHAVDGFSERTDHTVHGWSVYADTDHTPGRYVMFLETEPVIADGDVARCRAILEEELGEANRFYGHYVRDGHLAPMRLLRVHPQTYELYQELAEFRGASANQLKPVHVIDSPSRQRFFLALSLPESREDGASC